MLTRKASNPSRIPVIETLKPLKLENGMYDYLAEPEEEEVKKPKAKKSPKAESTKKSENKSEPVTPKAKKEEAVNLLKANIEAKNKRKSAPLSPGKEAKTQLDTAISQLSLDAVQQKYTQLLALFPGNMSLVAMHMAAFFNQSLNDVPDVEPNMMHENESNMYPSNKLEKKLEKFMNNLICKLKRPEAEFVFEYCLTEIIKNDNPKVLSNHGNRIFIQLLIKANQNILMSNLMKTAAELLSANRHRHQRIMLALWALSQAGFYSLTNGLTIWFELMLPLMNVKHFTVYISSYLHALFSHHKIDAHSIVAKLKDQYIINLDQYLTIYEIVNDSVITNKEAAQRLKSSFALIRALFLSNLKFSPQTGLIFETLLVSLTVESSVKQTEFLELLANCLFANENALEMWQGIYLKNIQQSTLLIEYLTVSHNKKFRGIKNMNVVLKKFDQDSLSVIQLSAALSPAKEDSKKPYYISKKSQKSTNNTAELEKFNKLVKTTLKQNFKRVSFFSVMFRTFLTFAMFTAIFFYWDKNHNKSIYFKAGHNQLDKYGVIKETNRLVEETKKSLLKAQKMAEHHIPIWYKKTSDTVLPYTQKAWKMTDEYSQLAWENTKDLRKSADVYYQTANKYVQENLPVLKKSLNTYAEIAYAYGVKTNNAAILYANQATHYVGTQLLGWKKGELENVFMEAYKVVNDSLKVSLDWIAKSIRNLSK